MALLGCKMNAHPLPVLTIQELTAFWSSVDKTADCWNWNGTQVWTAKSANTKHIYGVFNIQRNGRRFNLKAHRVTKSLSTGDHPEFDIDHTCKNKLCVNPDHLDWVTHQENRRRAWRSHCKNGHDISRPELRTKNGWRCRQCDVERNRARRAAQRGAPFLRSGDA